MNVFKSRFVLTNSQQNGILILAGLIFIIVLAKYYYNTQLSNIPSKSIILDSIAQQKLDSLKALKLKEKTNYVNKIYSFNPNFLKEGKAYRLGISAEEFDRLQAYRLGGKWINSAEDFQNVTKVSDEVLAKISPYFKFPEWVIKKQQQNKKTKKSPKGKDIKKKDLNLATVQDLQKINGIGEKLSRRILNYRNKIGQFRSEIQLKDVYGLNVEVIEKISQNFEIKVEDVPEPIDINTASIIQLAEVPYFNYELAREIFQFIKVNEGITSFEELSKLQQFPNSKIDRIKLYLAIIE
jgi:competence ComEA-like helix-hairpin-helix protein